MELAERGEIDRALDRYFAVGNVAAAMELVPRPGRDDDAYLFLAEYKAYEELAELVDRGKGQRLSHDFIMRHGPESERYAYEEYGSTLLVHILRHLAGRRDDPEAAGAERREEIDAHLGAGFSSTYLQVIESCSLDIVDYLIRIGHANALFFLKRIAFGTSPETREFLGGLRSRVELAAETGPRAGLFAALAAALEYRAAPAALPPEGLGPWTTIPYLTGGTNPSAALEYLYARTPKRLDHFASILRIEALVGAWHEAAGRHLEAAKLFAKANRWRDVRRTAAIAKRKTPPADRGLEQGELF